MKSFFFRKVFFPMLCVISCAFVDCQAKNSDDCDKAIRNRPHELAGFLLEQYPKAFSATLGTPFHEDDAGDGRIARAYHVPKSKDAYLVVYWGTDPKDFAHDHAMEMELTGEDYAGPTGFFGLKLGDSAENVEAVLGKPDEIRNETGEELDLWDYKSKNYTLEFTKAHKLYSIQIINEAADGVPGIAGGTQVREFAEAVQREDIDQILRMSSGEIECSKGRVFGIQGGAARTVLSDSQSDVSKCLRSAAEAILALGRDLRGTEDDIRIWTKHSPGFVTKFPSTSPLKEVVFDQEAGAWRVYEVTFRDPVK